MLASAFPQQPPRLLSVFRCGPDSACKGNITLRDSGSALDCAPGFGGVLCSSCIKGFRRKKDKQTFRCEQCAPNMHRGQQLVFWAVMLAGSIGLFVLLASCLSGHQAHEDAARIKKLKGLQAQMKILLSTAQVLRLCSSSFQITIPSPFAELAHSFGLLTFDVLDLEIVPLGCLFDFDFRHKFAASCAMPLVLVLVIKLVGLGIARRGSATKALEEASRAWNERNTKWRELLLAHHRYTSWYAYQSVAHLPSRHCTAVANPDFARRTLTRAAPLT